MKAKFIFVAFVILLMNCNNRHYSPVEVKNPAFRPNTVFHAYFTAVIL